MTSALKLRQQAEKLAAPLPPLLAEAERIAASVLQGVHGRRRAGTGETFWQYRPYAQGDSVASIDWRQSARSDRLYVRQNEWEASNAVWLWPDGSASMDFASSANTPTKARRAKVLALALGALLTQGGERVALFGGPEKPSAGRGALRRLARDIAADRGADGFDADDGGAAARGARLVALSDFYRAPTQFTDAVDALARRGVKGHMVQIVDAMEEDFPFKGRTIFEDPETRSELLFGRADAVREAYRTKFYAHRAALGDAARRAGWTWSVHRTDAPPQTALLALYHAVAGEV